MLHGSLEPCRDLMSEGQRIRRRVEQMAALVVKAEKLRHRVRQIWPHRRLFPIVQFLLSDIILTRWEF